MRATRDKHSDMTHLKGSSDANGAQEPREHVGRRETVEDAAEEARGKGTEDGVLTGGGGEPREAS